MVQVKQLISPNSSQFWSLKIRRATFLNNIKLANILILRLQNCAIFGQGVPLERWGKPISLGKPNGSLSTLLCFPRFCPFLNSRQIIKEKMCLPPFAVTIITADRQSQLFPIQSLHRHKVSGNQSPTFRNRHCLSRHGNRQNVRKQVSPPPDRSFRDFKPSKSANRGILSNAKKSIHGF